MTRQLFYAVFAALFIFAAPHSSRAQTSGNTLQKVAEGLYFMYYDSSRSKSVVVEMENYLTLIEVPVLDHGGSVVDLKENYAGGEKILQTLALHFPGKPLRYLLHSHWHQHSLSALNPFLKNGVTLYTTRSSFERIRSFADSTLFKTGKNVVFVSADSLSIGDRTNRVNIHYFLQKDYPNTPTQEYLYFHLPRYDYLHCGCMFTRTPTYLFEQKEVITGRAEDLHRLIVQRGISPAALIRLPREKDRPEDMQPYGELENLIRNGISASVIMQRYAQIPDAVLLNRTDSIATVAITSKTASGFFNTLAYHCLEEGKNARALAYARIQTMTNPSDPNVWDTLGEVYWNMGQFDLARHYGRHSRIISPDFKEGGETVWQKGVEERKTASTRP